MKKPRVEDFDPNAKVPTLKSTLVNMPVIEKPTHTPLPEKPIIPKEQTKQPMPERATARPPDEQANRRGDRPSGRGVLVRRGFEWREDQLHRLKKLSLQEQLAGKPGSMSQMVRDALDDYLKKRASEQ